MPRQSCLQLTRRGAAGLPPFIPSILRGTCESTMDQDHDGWIVGCLVGTESSSRLHGAVSLIREKSRNFRPMSQDQFSSSGQWATKDRMTEWEEVSTL